MTHTYKFNVAMSCGGCSGAIERVLKKLEGPSAHSSPVSMTIFGILTNYSTGVESYEVSLEHQTAEIKAADDLSYDTVLEKIKKTGKTVKSGEADGEERAI